MFISLHLRKSGRILFIAAVVIIIGFVLFMFSARAVSTFSFNKEDKLPFTKADTEEKRQQLIGELGWEVKEVYSHQKVIIPGEFDETYFKYNELQRKQGLNLKRHRGKEAEKYTYIIENYPNDIPDVRLTLLLRKGKVIGGDVCNLGRDGFMHTLFYPHIEGSLEN